jgi:DNA polymerase II small subunit/DNA polymerase delta subunit B
MEIIDRFLEKGVLLSPDVMNKIKEEEVEELLTKFDKKKIVLTDDFYCFARGKGVKVVEEYKKESEVKRITNFVDFYNKRFEFLREILMEKLGQEKITSINKLNVGEATVIGMVREKKDNGFSLEDSTGSVFCKSDKNVLEDDVVAAKGNFNKKEFSAEKIFYPDIPLKNNVNTTGEECHVLFTKNLSKDPEGVHYIFAFGGEPDVLNKTNSWIVTKKDKIKKGPKHVGLNLPGVVEVEGIKIMIFDASFDELKKKTGEKDEKKLITSLLQRRHLLPFVYMENDPYLIEDIPDLIFFPGKEPFFLNYKGVSAVSVTDKKSFLVNLKTRDYEEV